MTPIKRMERLIRIMETDGCHCRPDEVCSIHHAAIELYIALAQVEALIPNEHNKTK